MGEGNLYCPTSQRVQRWERMGEDVAGLLDGKGRRGALLALQFTGFVTSQTSQLQASQVGGSQVHRSRWVYGGKEGNTASFYTNNSHNPADIALATSHSELAGVAVLQGLEVRCLRRVRSCRVHSRRVRSRRVRSRRQKICKVSSYRLAEDVFTEEGLQLKDSSSSEGK